MIDFKGIHKTYPGEVPLHVLKGVDLHIDEGELVSIMGPSGSGKSTMLNIMGILDDYDEGEYRLAGRLVKNLNEKTEALYRNELIGFIFQSFNLINFKNAMENVAVPLYYRGVKRKERNRLAMEYLEKVGLAEHWHHLPMQLSGGQRQRVLIAGAALLEPRLLICDEPTSSLDTVTTIQILNLLKEICHKMHMTVLFISHDLSAVRNFCDRVMVMRGGEIVDRDTTQEMLLHPRSGYTAELLTNARLDTRMLGLERATVDYSASPVLVARDITARYDNSSSNVLKGASLEIYPREMLGLIGSSGCGKTTLVKTLLGLMPHGGSITCNDKQTGAVFQDPVSCLNPAHTIEWHLLEPLRAAGIKITKEERRKRVESALQDVGMSPEYLSRKPRQLSGGQRQRIAIAMSLILEPSLIVADEPFSSLDSSSASEILKLLTDINRERGTSFLLITHNIHIVRQICPRVIVMDKGSVCEEGLTSEVLSDPKSDAARKLLHAESVLHGENFTE